jgi:hypothetical protein
MAIQATVTVGVPVCPSWVSQWCPGLNRFVRALVPVSQYVIAHACRRTQETITHALILTINRNTGSDRDTGTRVKNTRYRVRVQQREAA